MEEKKNPKEIHEENRMLAEVRDLMQTPQWRRLRREIDAAIGGDGRDPNAVNKCISDMIYRAGVEYISQKWKG